MSDLRGQADDGAELTAEDVSRAYRLAAREEPSPEIDAAIHAAAVRPAGSRQRSYTRRPLGRWGVPMAVAATIVIGVSIAFLAADRPDSPLTPGGEAPVPLSRESKQPAPAPSAPSAGTVATPADSTPRQAAQPAPETIGGQAPVAAAARGARPTRERTTRDEVVPRREQPVSPSAAPESEERPEALATRAPDATPAAPAAAAFEAPRPHAVPEAARAMRKTAPTGDMQAGEEAEPLSPEMWLQRIRELRNKGELAQADESLRAFRRRFPDYPLPADVPLPAQVGK